MNKKIIAIIIIVLVIVVGLYQFVYVPYQDVLAKKHYNEGLQNASNIDKQLNESFNKLGNLTSSDVTGGFESRIQTFNDSIAKYDEQIEILNRTRKYANGNATKEKYIDDEIELTQIEKSTSTELVKESNDFLDAYNNMNISKMEDATKKMEKTTDTKTIEVKQVQDDIIKILGDNPDLNQTVHRMNLTKKYTGG